MAKPVLPILPALLAALLSGCAFAPPRVPIAAEPVSPAEESKWSGYGAYVVLDDYYIEDVAANGGRQLKVVSEKVVKILTPEGVSKGILEPPDVKWVVPKVRLIMRDSAGRPVKLDTVKMIQEYRTKGKLVFPNVTAGTVLGAYVEFRPAPGTAAYEHWFSGDLPVARGRFTFAYHNSTEFDFAEHGPVRKIETELAKPAGAFEFRTWEVRNAFPRSNLEYQEDIDVAEPRVSIAMRMFGGIKVFSDWGRLAENYQEAAFKPAFLHSSRKLRAKADSLTAGAAGPEAKAQAVFHWVQENITLEEKPLARIDPDRVIASGKGNIWESASVLKAMFSHIGLETDVLVTRPRRYGGFDPGFVSPLQVTVPLVTVKVAGKSLLAFPYLRGGALGEYPQDFSGLSGLSLLNQDPVALPPYSGSGSQSTFTYRIDLADPEGDQKLELGLSGYLAYAARFALFKESKSETRETFQKFLSHIGPSNALTACELTGRDEPGKPLSAKLAFRNPNQVVERNGEIQFRLSHLFHAQFASYDTSRAAGFNNPVESRQVVKLIVPAVPGKRIEADIPCVNEENALFKLECTAESGAEGYTHTRDLTIRKVKMSAGRLRELYPKIIELNRASDGRIVLRNAAPSEAGARAAKPKAR